MQDKTTPRDWKSMRGFNYQPSYSARLEHAWTDFRAETWKRETSWATRFGANTMRIWLDWGAYLTLEDVLLDRFDKALAILDSNGIKAMPVLFNRWVDTRYPAGGISDNDLLSAGPTFDKFDNYINSTMARFGSDPRISIWDLCNEPFHSVVSKEIQARESEWLSTTAAHVRRSSKIPLTIGAMTYEYVRKTASLCDVVSFHPYPHHVGEMDKYCQDHLAIASEYNKPLICTETCCGSLDDNERGLLAKDNIESLEKHGIGWTAWMLCEGKFVSGSPARVDSNSIRPNEGYMAFVLRNGNTRPGHEWLENR